jgi:hypothetical protein
LLTGLLAAIGLAEMLLQRVLYRVGLHLPRDGTFQDVYHLATLAGDFAFRLASVLLLLATLTVVVWLLSHRMTLVTGLLTGGLALANLLAWPLGASWAPALVAFSFVFATVWLVGRYSAAQSQGLWFVIGVGAASLALAVSQYGAGMSALAGRPEPFDVSDVQLASEALLVGATFAFASAALIRRRRTATWPIASGALLAMVLVAAYLREPATVAITSLWAIGFTMSLPAVLYFAAVAAAVSAILIWFRDGGSRHLAVGVVLLFVAGIQPQAVHHSLTASLGLILLYSGPLGLSGRDPEEGDLPNAVV